MYRFVSLTSTFLAAALTVTAGLAAQRGPALSERDIASVVPLERPHHGRHVELVVVGQDGDRIAGPELCTELVEDLVGPGDP